MAGHRKRNTIKHKGDPEKVAELTREMAAEADQQAEVDHEVNYDLVEKVIREHRVAFEILRAATDDRHSRDVASAPSGA